MAEWQLWHDALAWLERLRALLEGCGGWTAEEQLVLKQLAHELLWCVAGLYDTPAVVMTPRRVPDHDASLRLESPELDPVPPPVRRATRAAAGRRNGQRDRGECTRWSLNERLRELGYPEDLSRSQRITLGQAVVEAYKQAHGKAPAMADRGRGSQATRVSLYDAADLPMVDAIIQNRLGNLPREGEVANEGTQEVS
jgi:hypothetical protein